MTSKTFILFLGGSLLLHAGLALDILKMREDQSAFKKEEAVFIASIYDLPAQKNPKKIKQEIPKKKKSTRTMAPTVTQTVVEEETRALLADPQKGEIFMEYFGLIKEKIQYTVRQEHVDERLGQGTVTLMFVLTENGNLEKVLVDGEGTKANDRLKTFAVDCLKKSAPFFPFPQELDRRRLFFNITLLF